MKSRREKGECKGVRQQQGIQTLMVRKVNSVVKVEEVHEKTNTE
jgi:hypothetical protein